MTNLRVTFRNIAQVVLYECEFKGQFSDGNWENAEPYDAWKQPCDAVASVAKPGEALGTHNFYPRILYGFSSPNLLDCCGDRMIFWVKSAMAYPEKVQEMIANEWTWETDHAQDPKIALQSYTLAQLKTDLRDMSRIWAGRPSAEEERAQKKAEKAQREIDDREYKLRQIESNRAYARKLLTERVAKLQEDLGKAQAELTQYE
jgi:hypothetical protein